MNGNLFTTFFSSLMALVMMIFPGFSSGSSPAGTNTPSSSVIQNEPSFSYAPRPGVLPEALIPTEKSINGSTNNGRRDREYLDWLRSSGGLFPGAGIYTKKAGGLCTVGWILSDSNGNKYVLTAGHCTSGIGDVFHIIDKNGRKVRVGEVVDSMDSDSPYFDYAVIRISNPDIPVSPVLPVKNASYSTASAVLSPSTEEREEHTVCHIGYRLGISCGVPALKLPGAFENEYNWYGYGVAGESGGPVFAIDDNGVFHPLGLHTVQYEKSSFDGSHPIRLGYIPLETVLARLGGTYRLDI